MPNTNATAFQRAILTFMAWEETSSDPERAESEFRNAMRAFLTTEIRMRTLRLRTHHAPLPSLLVTSTQPKLADGVQLQGQLYDFPVDLAGLMAEGWTSIHSLDLRGTPRVILESRPPMSSEEAAARAQYERLKQRFEPAPSFTVKSTEEADAENMALDAAGVPPVPSEEWLEDWFDTKATDASARPGGRVP